MIIGMFSFKHGCCFELCVLALDHPVIIVRGYVGRRGRDRMVVRFISME
jgi:hypothetical protein